MGKRKTTSEFISEVKALVGDEYTVMSEYVNRVEKVSLRHNVCGNIYAVAPTNFLGGERCPTCSHKSRRLSPDSFSSWFVSTVGDEYTQIDPYVKSSEKIRVKHNVCGTVYSVTPNNFKKGKRCRVCHNKSLVKTQEQFDADLFLRWGKQIVCVSPYMGVAKLLTLKCNKHNCLFSMYPTSILNRESAGCPMCKHENTPTPFQVTKPEQNIFNVLSSLGISFVYQKMFDDCRSSYQPLPFDFYIPSMNLIIEYDGRQHYIPIDLFGGESGYERTSRNDSIKTDYALSHNINIARIPYTCNELSKAVKSLVYCENTSKNKYIINKKD